MFSWSKSEKQTVDIEELKSFHKTAMNTLVSVNVGHFVYIDSRYSDINFGYIYDVKSLPDTYTKLGYARNLKMVCVEKGRISLKEVHSRICKSVNIQSTSDPNENMLLNFVLDVEHNDFKSGQLVRPKKGVQLFYTSGYKFSSEDKLLSPMIVTNVSEHIVTIPGKTENGDILEVEINKILLHSY